MRPELLKKTYSLKNELSQLAVSLNEEIKKEEVLSKWKDYSPAPVNRFAVAADGSFNKKHYIGFYLYSVSGYAVGLRNGSTVVEEVTGDINLSVIKKTELIDQYLRMLMFLCEMKALLKLAKSEKPEVLLIDGTLSSRFITVFPKTDWFCSEEFEGKIASIAGEFIPVLKDTLLREDIVAFSEEIKEKVMKTLFKEFGEKGLRRDIVEATLSKIAYFEYLLLLHRLFYGMDFKPVVIGVAKTSHSTDIFKKSLPDIRVLHQFVRSTGYTSPHTYVNLDEIKWEFSQVFEFIEESVAYRAERCQYKIFLRKVRQRKTISLIEYYENPELEGISPEYILDILSHFSVSGYPFPLRKADYEVRITRRDMEMIENL
ncbi:MAG: DNA double-strand break repair nuclease NurA [Persephonella sp.]|nr:DNA double-strand break repair nuclease NurA [Persephonella sp.]